MTPMLLAALASTLITQPGAASAQGPTEIDAARESAVREYHACLHCAGPADHAGHDLDAPAPAGAAARERIVVRFHVVRRTDGTGGLDESVIPDVMRDLNWGFRDTDFAFVREPGVRYIDNDAYYADMPNVLDQIPPINEAYEDGVLSWVFVPSLFGGTIDAGTWLGRPFTNSERGVIHAYYAAGQPRRIVTPIHEMGHVFGVDHPYETVFGVECTSGANCSNSGDRICDTPASPAVFSANTKATGEFYASIPGPCEGDPDYAPNTRLFMDAGWEGGHLLRSEFTPGQVEKMLRRRANHHPDLTGPLRPDVLVDCDGDGLDDIDQITAGLVADVNRDLIPDSCQVFAAPGDLIVFDMANSGIQRPRIFDTRTGEHRGDVWSGLSWSHTGRAGPDGLIYVPRLTFVYRLDLRTGRGKDAILDGVVEGASVLADILFRADGSMLVLDNADSTVRRYLGDGTFDAVFCDLGAAGVSGAKFMEFGPAGDIFVAANGALGNRIHRVSGGDGTYAGAFTAPGAGGMGAGQGLVFRGDELFVSDGATNSVLRFDALTGAFLGIFVPSGASGGLSSPHKLAFGPDGHLYVASRGNHAIKRYDGVTGAFIGDVVSPGQAGVASPAGFVFAPPAVCPADFDANGTLDTDDIDAFVVEFLAGSTGADLTGDGVLNIDDIDAFVAAFIGGCA